MKVNHFFRRTRVLFVNNFRVLSTHQAVDPVLDAKVQDDIESDRIKPRKHPGVLKVPTCSLPEDIVKSIEILAEGHTLKHILVDAKTLANYLFSRHYPWEDEDLRERQAGFIEDVKSKSKYLLISQPGIKFSIYLCKPC